MVGVHRFKLPGSQEFAEHLTPSPLRSFCRTKSGPARAVTCWQRPPTPGSNKGAFPSPATLAQQQAALSRNLFSKWRVFVLGHAAMRDQAERRSNNRS